MATTERPFSDLLRHPNKVADTLGSVDVVLKRRDAPDLELTRADRAESRRESFRALARAFRSLAVTNPSVLKATLSDAFTWTEFLPPHEKDLFVEEFSRLVTASAEIDEFDSLVQMISEWRTTATVYADPRLARRLRGPIEAAGGPVDRPVTTAE